MANTLEQALYNTDTTTSDELYIVVDNDRIVMVPNEFTKIAVTNDTRAVTVTFNCPRIFGNVDLGILNVYIICTTSAGMFFRIPVDNKIVEESAIKFDWIITGGITAYPGKISFAIEAMDTEDVETSTVVWHSEINNSMSVVNGLNDIRTVYAVPGSEILIGKYDENLATEVIFTEPAAWSSKYGDGNAQLVYRRPAESTAYPIMLQKMETGSYIWIIDRTNTEIPGHGEAELRYMVNDVLVKSVVYDIVIEKGIGDFGDAPIQPSASYLNQIIEQANRAKSEADRAKEQADRSIQTVVLSETEPTNPDTKIWINPNGQPTFYATEEYVDNKLSLKLDKSPIGNATPEDTQEVHLTPEGKLVTKSSGAVDSVNGKTGAVILKLGDLDSDTTHQTVTDSEKNEWNGKLDKSPIGAATPEDTQEVHLTSEGKLMTKPTSSGGGSNIDDSAVATDSTWSSKKITDTSMQMYELASQYTDHMSAGKLDKATIGDVTSNDTQEVHLTPEGKLLTTPISAIINDETLSHDTTWSSQQLSTRIDIMEDTLLDTISLMENVILDKTLIGAATPEDTQEVHLTPEGKLMTKPTSGGTTAFGYEEGAESTVELKANVFHKFTTPAETITVTTTPSTGYAEYSFQFTTASSGGNLSIPADFAWNSGKAPELKPNMTYQVVLFSGTAYISGGVAV